MKRFFILALSATLLCLSSAAQENFYVIDGEHIENFDGSQLVGKVIKHYDLKYLPEAKTTIHNIFTTDDWMKIEGVKTTSNVHVLTKEEAEARGLPLKTSTMKAELHNPLMIVDGEEFTGNISDITIDIDYIDIYKPGDEVAKAYGEKGKNGVMKIFTKKLPDAVTYFIDGQPATKADFNRLSPNNIDKIKVLKRGTAQALQVSPDGNTNDIYLITTK